MFQDVESLHNEKEQLRRQLQDEFSLKSPRDLSCLLSLQNGRTFLRVVCGMALGRLIIVHFDCLHLSTKPSRLGF